MGDREGGVGWREGGGMVTGRQGGREGGEGGGGKEGGKEGWTEPLPSLIIINHKHQAECW